MAYFESYDDSPQWWHVARYNEKTGTLEQDTVERNCLYAMDCWVLAWLARQLGQQHEAEELLAEHARMADNINRLLWDPSRGCYFNRDGGRSGGLFLSPEIAGHLHVPARQSSGPEQAEPRRNLP